MTITQNNKLNIAYKRLSGLINSNPAYGTGNESIASNVQIGSSTIFGQAIDTDPAVAVADGIAERKIFRIKDIASGFYKEDPETIDKPHVWKLQKFNGSEWVDFEGQLIGSSFGEGYYPKLYRVFGGANGTDFGASDVNLSDEVSKLSVLNWTLDYFAGTLWFQNLTAETPTVEWVVVAYEYTGQYLDAVVGSGGGGGTSPLPTEDTLYKPSEDTLANSYDYIVGTSNFANTVKYIFLHGNQTGYGTSYPDDSHKVTRLQLWQHQYGNNTKEIVVKNLGHTGDSNIPSTIEIQVSTDGLTGYTLNGSRDSHYLYAVGETATLLWDGTEWHII